MTNFPSPESEYAQLPLTAVAFLAGLPLNLLYLIIKSYKYCFKRNEEPKNEKEIYDIVPTTEINWNLKL